MVDGRGKVDGVDGAWKGDGRLKIKYLRDGWYYIHSVKSVVPKHEQHQSSAYAQDGATDNLMGHGGQAPDQFVSEWYIIHR